MCTLALLRTVSTRFPVIVAANRDEYFHRPTRAPELLADPAGVVAGRDLDAGGTWLGCRVRDGRFFAAGLLNRRTAAARPPSGTLLRSRGLLCLDALRQYDITSALETLGRLGYDEYQPFNLLLVDSDRAVVVDNHAGVTITELGHGLSVLTNIAVNDPRCPRLASAHAGFARRLDPIARGAGAEEIVAELGAVLGDHEGSADPTSADPFARVCVHAGAYGTRSASILIADATGHVRFFHADDAPCRAAFREISTGGSG